MVLEYVNVVPELRCDGPMISITTERKMARVDCGRLLVRGLLGRGKSQVKPCRVLFAKRKIGPAWSETASDGGPLDSSDRKIQSQMQSCWERSSSYCFAIDTTTLSVVNHQNKNRSCQCQVRCTSQSRRRRERIVVR